MAKMPEVLGSKEGWQQAKQGWGTAGNFLPGEILLLSPFCLIVVVFLETCTRKDFAAEEFICSCCLFFI